MKDFDSNWNAIFNKGKEMQVRVQEKIGTCGCGRSPTGNCIGWHGLSESEYQAKLVSYVAEQDAKDEK
jgi:hypothetical protein